MPSPRIAVALLVDLVSSRGSGREELHAATLRALDRVNATVKSVEHLHPTVGDEFQGVYPTIGSALNATFTLRLALAPKWQARFGIGGGEIRTIDASLGIQDGSAWWLARESIAWVEKQAKKKGYASARTAIRDERTAATAQADAMVRLVDAHVGRLRAGALGSLRGLWEGLDNNAIAEREGISGSANSQRVLGNDLRPLHDAMRALSTLP